MNKTEFENKFKNYIDTINSRLDDLVKIEETAQIDVFKAMKYSLDAGGKRIRPVLVMAIADLLFNNPKMPNKVSDNEKDAVMRDACYVGCAIECIHTYSLIHDDLPCMDDDDLRRGMPSCHIKFDEATALLAGDALLNKAFEILSNASEYVYADFEKIIKIISDISTSSGAFGMIGGQIIDLKSENMTSVSEEHLTLMHRLKTGALIKTSAVCGAVLLGADEKVLSEIEKFAEYLGLAFQIKDDILDCVGCEALLGKPIGSDFESNKTTYVTLFGLDGAEKLLRDTTEKAVGIISNYENSEFIVELLNFLLNREF